MRLTGPLVAALPLPGSIALPATPALPARPPAAAAVPHHARDVRARAVWKAVRALNGQRRRLARKDIECDLRQLAVAPAAAPTLLWPTILRRLHAEARLPPGQLPHVPHTP